MPTYEYKCSACGHAFERFQSIMADPIKRCPECGKAKVKRLIGTGAGLIFKGSGFYITDYRDAGYKEKAKAESGASGDASGGGDAKSDKPEVKSGTKAESKSGDGGAGASNANSGTGGESKAAAPKPDAKSASKSADKTTKKKGKS